MAIDSSDPRRPNALCSFVREPVEYPRSVSEWYSTFALICAAVGFLQKWTPWAWVSLVLCGASFANMRRGDTDVKTLSFSVMFATSALVVSYAQQMDRASALAAALERALNATIEAPIA